MFHCGQIGNCNPILVGFAKHSGVDLKSKHFADIYRQKHPSELKLRGAADKSYKNRRFSALRRTGAICLHSYSKRVIHESARITANRVPFPSLSPSLESGSWHSPALGGTLTRATGARNCNFSIDITQNHNPRALAARVERSAGRWRMPRTSQRLVRVRINGTRFAVIRADSWIVPFSMRPKPNKKPNHKINT